MTRVLLGVLVVASLVYLLIIVIGLSLFGIAWVIRRLSALRVVPQRAGAESSPRDDGGKPEPCTFTPSQDDGDETPDTAVAEGLGTPSLTPWPGIDTIDAVKRANPRLTDIQAYAVAVARSRLKAAR